jgi:hypothetical protein
VCVSGGGGGRGGSREGMLVCKCLVPLGCLLCSVQSSVSTRPAMPVREIPTLSSIVEYGCHV